MNDFSITLLYTTPKQSQVPRRNQFRGGSHSFRPDATYKSYGQKLHHVPRRLAVMGCLATRSVDVSLSHQPKDITTAVLSRALSSIS